MVRELNDDFTSKLEDAVQKAREHEEWRLEYMTLMQRDRQNREEGHMEGRVEGIGVLVETLKEFGQPVESIIKKIMEKFDLSEAEAKKYV